MRQKTLRKMTPKGRLTRTTWNLFGTMKSPTKVLKVAQAMWAKTKHLIHVVTIAQVTAHAERSRCCRLILARRHGPHWKSKCSSRTVTGKRLKTNLGPSRFSNAPSVSARSWGSSLKTLMTIFSSQRSCGRVIYTASCVCMTRL